MALGLGKRKDEMTLLRGLSLQVSVNAEAEFTHQIPGPQEVNPQPGAKRWLLFRATAASKTDTAINENILLALLGFAGENRKAVLCLKTATDFVGGLSQSVRWI